MNKINYAEMTDWELVFKAKTNDKKANETLFFRYKNLVKGMKSTLYKKSVEFDMYLGNYLADYEHETYETYLKAVNNVDEAKLKDATKKKWDSGKAPKKYTSFDSLWEDTKKNWKFYICFKMYLQSHNRDIIYWYCNETKHKRPMEVAATSDEIVNVIDLNVDASVPSSEDIVLEAEKTKAIRSAIAAAYSKMNETEKKIMDGLNSGKTKKEIASDLNITVKDYNSSLKKVQSIMSRTLQSSSLKYGEKLW